MIKEQFIINTLKPYFLDHNLCGYETYDNICSYLTLEGKTCAVGKWLDKNNPNYKKIIHSNTTVIPIDDSYGLDNVLVEDAKYILNIVEWRCVQNIHDALAKGDKHKVKSFIISLEELTNINFAELKELL